MDSISFPYSEEQKPAFVTATETKTSNTPVSKQESFTSMESRSVTSNAESVFSPMAAQFQGRGGNELLNLLAQQEPRAADTAPTAADIDLLAYRMNGTDLLFDDIANNNQDNFFMGGNRPESVASNMWTEGSGVSTSRNGEMIDTFDFLVKSLSSANNYVSMLTREQLSVLRSIRPSLLYEFLQEIAKVRSDKRMRRALPNECAFCKNNGENEECYSSHALKDWRGRVLCPVLRAFRCPRCGATGDRAHTIKYCPENHEAGSERLGLAARRRVATSPSLVLGGSGSLPPSLRTPQPAAPASSPAPSSAPASANINHNSLWWMEGMN